MKKDEDFEHDLFTKVRNAEYSRQKKEQDVKRLAAALAEAKRVNAVKLKQEMLDKQKEEKDLEQELAKHQADLSRVSNYKTQLTGKLCDVHQKGVIPKVPLYF